VTALETVLEAVPAPPAFTDRLIGIRELRQRVPFKRAGLQAKIDADEFPPPEPRARPKARRVWRWSVVDAYLRGEWRPPAK